MDWIEHKTPTTDNHRHYAACMIVKIGKTPTTDNHAHPHITFWWGLALSPLLFVKLRL